jgi:hypothetical protein
MVQTKIWQMTLFQNIILLTNHYGNLQEMLEMASFLKYVDLYLTSEWGRFYMGHSLFPRAPDDRNFRQSIKIKEKQADVTKKVSLFTEHIRTDDNCSYSSEMSL